MSEINAGILGMGHAYPEGVLTNADLEKIVETSDEWITSRTGIKQRHKAKENEYTSMFGTAAAKQALERAGLEPTDIDLIVCATTTPTRYALDRGFDPAQLGRRMRPDGHFRGLLGFHLRPDDGRTMIRPARSGTLVIGAEVLTNTLTTPIGRRA